MPNGPNALRAYAPARTRVAERPPRASWAFFCAADADVDADEDEDVEDSAVEVVKGDAARRRRGAGLRSRLRRKVVTIMSFFFFFSFPFFSGGRARGVMSWVGDGRPRSSRRVEFRVGRLGATELRGVPGGRIPTAMAAPNPSAVALRESPYRLTFFTPT